MLIKLEPSRVEDNAERSPPLRVLPRNVQRHVFGPGPRGIGFVTALLRSRTWFSFPGSRSERAKVHLHLVFANKSKLVPGGGCGPILRPESFFLFFFYGSWAFTGSNNMFTCPGGGWIPAVTQASPGHHDAEPWRRGADAAEENGAPSDASTVNDETQPAAANPEKPLAAVACVNSTIADSFLCSNSWIM